MGGRDHSYTCEVCGCQRGGLNDYECECDERGIVRCQLCDYPLETPPPVRIKLKDADPETIRILQLAQQTRQMVRSWPSWKANFCTCLWRAMDMLAENLAQGARLCQSYELGNRGCTEWDDFWLPGCGRPAPTVTIY